MGILAVYRGDMGIVEKKMEATIYGLGFRVSQNEGYLFRGFP